MNGKVLVKPGAEFAVIAPSGYLILHAIKAAARKLALDITITSGTDGDHSGPTDPHKVGKAYDVRSHDFADSLKVLLLRAILSDLRGGAANQLFETSGGLATEYFYGFLEAPGTGNEHFHIQQRKGTLFGITDLLIFEQKVEAV